MSLTQLFTDICQWFIPKWEQNQLENGEKKRNQSRALSQSEIITIIIYFPQSGYRTFKWFHEKHVCNILTK